MLIASSMIMWPQHTNKISSFQFAVTAYVATKWRNLASVCVVHTFIQPQGGTLHKSHGLNKVNTIRSSPSGLRTILENFIFDHLWTPPL